MIRQSKLEAVKDELISEYLSGKSSVELGRKYEVSYQTILMFLRKNSISIRDMSHSNIKYRLKEDFFNEINTQEKAYFLGLLYADGCNSTERSCVRLVLTATDKKLLEDLSKLIFFDDKALTLRKGKAFKDKGKEYLRKDSYCLSISNKHISDTLNKKGLTKAKSFTITFPDWLQEDFIPHFIRGYFDGDGSISLCKSGQASISILGTKQFCESLQQEIFKTLEFKPSICHAKKGSAIKQINIHGNRVCRNFLDWIYKDSSIHLDRKYSKYLEILEAIPPIIMCIICGGKNHSNGYCKLHYYEFVGRQKRHELYLRKKNSG